MKLSNAKNVEWAVTWFVGVALVTFLALLSGVAFGQTKRTEVYTDSNAMVHQLELRKVPVLRADGGVLRYDVEATAYGSIASDDGDASKSVSNRMMLERPSLRTAALDLMDQQGKRILLPGAGFDGGQP